MTFKFGALIRSDMMACFLQIYFDEDIEVHSSDGFELEFSGSSEPELKIFRAESSRAGAF